MVVASKTDHTSLCEQLETTWNSTTKETVEKSIKTMKKASCQYERFLLCVKKDYLVDEEIISNIHFTCK